MTMIGVSVKTAILPQRKEYPSYTLNVLLVLSHSMTRLFHSANPRTYDPKLDLDMLVPCDLYLSILHYSKLNILIAKAKNQVYYTLDMETEFEVKFYPVDKEEYRQKLKEAGAELITSERKMRRIIFDYRNQSSKFQCDYLRVRDEGDVVRLSAKTHAREDGNIADQKEVDVIVSDFDKTVQILRLAGLKSDRFQINLRETWKFENTEIVIDSWPWLDTYTEIEGPTEQSVKVAAEKLGFDWNRSIVTSVTEVYMKVYNLSEEEVLEKISDINFEKNPFEGLEKHSI
jgi:adenylate cyclase, class 2